MLHRTPLLGAILFVGAVLTVRQSHAVARPQPDDLFRTADRCLACHKGVSTSDGVDVSIGYDWRASMMANSARGVMKVELASITQVTPITDRIADTAGLPYETLTELRGVQQLDRFDDSRALLLVQDSSGLNLQTIALP